MESKFNSKKKNNIDNHGENSTRYDTKTVIQTNNKFTFKECFVRLDPPVIMNRLKKYARKLPETIEDSTFGLNQRYPKRRKIVHKQEELNKIKSKYIGPFDFDYLTKNSINIYRKLKFKGKMYNIKRNKNPTPFSKLIPEIVLDFIKQPSVNKVTQLLDLIYTESAQNYTHSNDLTSCKKNRRMSIRLKEYLFELCYRKFCELWLHKTPRVSLLSSKQFKQFIRTLLKHAKCRTTISGMNLKKLILHNRGLSDYPKKPHLMLCIDIICSFFNTISRKCFRMIRMGYKKKANCISYNNNIHSIKLYHKGTTKRKTFLEIIDEYKQIINADRLSFDQVADIKHAYEGILGPGQCIDKVDLEKCANENYEFNRFQDDTKINHTDTFIFDDFDASNNYDFDFDDIDHTPACLLQLLNDIPTPQFNDYLHYDNFLGNTLVKEVLSPNYFVTKSDNNYLEATEDNLRKGFINCLEQDITAIVNQDMDISVNNFEVATKYSGVESSSNQDFKDDKFPEHILEWVTEVQSRNYFIIKDNKNYLKTIEDNSRIGSIEAIGERVHIQSTSREYHEIENRILKHSSREVNSLVHERTAIVNQDIDIFTGNLHGTTATTSLFQNKLSSNAIRLTDRIGKRILSIIINSNVNLRKVNWKRYPPSTRAKLYKIIVYFGSFKTALCNKLNLDHLSLIENNICDRIDVKKLLKTIQTSSLKNYFTFTEAENYLIWPLAKTISQKGSTVSILYKFVKNIISTFYEKVKDLLQKVGLKIILDEDALLESLSYTQIRMSILNKNVQTNQMNSKMSLDTRNISVLNELNILNNIAIDSLDPQFLKFKNDIILELIKTIDEINNIKISTCKNIKSFNENNQFDNAFIDDLIDVDVHSSNTENFNKKYLSYNETLMYDALNHVVEFEKFIFNEIFQLTCGRILNNDLEEILNSPSLEESVYDGTSNQDFSQHYEEDKSLEELLDEIPVDFENEDSFNFDFPSGFYNAGVLEPPENY